MFIRSLFLSAIFVAAPAAAQTVLTEDFNDADYAGWKNRWFGANSNALPYNRFDLSDRGANGTGLTLYDGDFAPDGSYNSTRVDIRFNADFGASLREFAFDILSYNQQRLEFYDLSGNVIFAEQLTPVGGPPYDFADANYTRYTVTSATGIAGFSLLPFGSEGNVSIDDLRATVAAVPEPASWATMIGGFALVGGALRRRRAAALA